MPDLLCLYPRFNAPGKRDVSAVFAPEAMNFALQHSALPSLVASFDNRQPLAARRSRCSALIAEARPRVLAVFCHGWRDGMQAGYRMRSCAELADVLRATGREQIVIALYACSTGDDGDADPNNVRTPGVGGEGGLADCLRDACRAVGVRATVVAHATAGHATRNPFVRVFAPDDAPGAGGTWLVEPGSSLWPRWKLALRAEADPLRLRFPLMPRSALVAELEALQVG